MGGGTGTGGVAGRRLENPTKTRRFDVQWDEVLRKSGRGLFVAAALGAFGLGAFKTVESADRADTIEKLEDADVMNNRLLSAATVLGEASVRFSDLSVNTDGEVVVEVPGTGASCESISFNYAETNEGWTLSFDQTDAGNRVFDTPKANDAAGVEALVQDLCS